MSGELQAQVGQHRREHDAACKDAHGNLRQDVAHHGHERQHPPRCAGEPALEELGRREYSGAQVERHQHPAEHQQAPGVQLIVGQRDPAGRACSRESDEVLRPDVRSEDGGADHEPSEAATRKEVVLCSVLVVVQDPPCQTRKRNEVRQNDQPVESRHTRSVTFLRATMRTVGPSTSEVSGHSLSRPTVPTRAPLGSGGSSANGEGWML